MSYGASPPSVSCSRILPSGSPIDLAAFAPTTWPRVVASRSTRRMTRSKIIAGSPRRRAAGLRGRRQEKGHQSRSRRPRIDLTAVSRSHRVRRARHTLPPLRQRLLAWGAAPSRRSRHARWQYTQSPSSEARIRRSGSSWSETVDRSQIEVPLSGHALAGISDRIRWTPCAEKGDRE